MLTLKEFENEVKGEGMSEATTKTYYRVLELYFKWINRNGKEKGIATAEEYVKSRVEEIKPATISLYRMTLRTYFRLNNIEIPKDRLKGMKVNNVREDKFITRAEVDELIRACDNLRDKVIFRLLFHTGVRASELLTIKGGDFDFANWRVYIRGLKGSHEVRSVRFIRPELVIPTIKAYMKQRSIDTKNPKHRKKTLIISNRGGKMSYTRLREIVGKYANVIGKPDLSPHWFRHGFVVWNKYHNVPAEVTAMQIGDTIKTTQDIYSHFSQADVDRVYDKMEGKREELDNEKDPIDIMEDMIIENRALRERMERLEFEFDTLKKIKEFISEKNKK